MLEIENQINSLLKKKLKFFFLKSSLQIKAKLLEVHSLKGEISHSMVNATPNSDYNSTVKKMICFCGDNMSINWDEYIF